jgi:hypothetical protein
MDFQDDAIEERQLDGRPLTTWSQYLHELNEGNPDAGVLRAKVNLSTVMGGFYRFRDNGRSNEAEERAVAIFKSAWERAEHNGARAFDPAAPFVDGGYRNPEAFLDHGADAKALKARIMAFLGVTDTKRMEQVAVRELKPTPYSMWRHGLMKPNRRQIAQDVKEVRGIAAKLAQFLELSGEGASRGTRAEGEAPTQFTGTVSSRRVA